MGRFEIHANDFTFDGKPFRVIAGAIVRPGPYICSEWDFGGLPWWLLKDDGMVLRCMYAPYLKAVDRFFDFIIPKIAKHHMIQKAVFITICKKTVFVIYSVC